MTSLKSKLLITFSLLLMTTTAQAGFLLEPYLGLGLAGSWEQGTSQGDYSYTGYGTKIGYQHPMGFQVGGDIEVNVVNFETDGQAGDNDGASALFGAFVGYQSMFGLRGYLSYAFSQALVVESGLVDATYTGGRTIKLGVGYAIIHWLAINLEYHMWNYTDFEQGTTSGSLTNDLEGNNIVLNVSFPLDFSKF